MEVFHRTQLAADLAKKILHVAPGSAAGSGLFLAAPRRTGKSTFLREDLRPELESAGALVVYVDLWKDKKADPGVVIVNAVRSELAKHESALKRLARNTGLEKVSVAGVGFNLQQVGLGDGVSLSDALAALSDEEKRPIALIIDEAQHAITSEMGSDALFALKAARDELNSSAHHGLRLVATGSNRDKLSMLRSSRDQAFFGAPLISFPPLGRDYVEWFCAGAGLAAPLDVDDTFTLFKEAANRPEILGAAADELRFDFELRPEEVRERFRAAVRKQIEESSQELLRVVHSLTPAQATVLRVLAGRGRGYAPFEAATLTAYGDVLKGLTGDPAAMLDVAQVQTALLALQEKALVWRAARGVYALEESSLADVMASHGMLDGVPGTQQRVERERERPA
ncbi:AAA family ATPase [Ramlibacter sp. AN1133]|uniref:AAA family ATPase n=1 Tax=Ramlibacter sp. AN1133 TaxID=3133429 RepID=UPI0030C3832D